MISQVPGGREQYLEEYVAAQGSRYWSEPGSFKILRQTTAWQYPLSEGLKLRDTTMMVIPLPEWASDIKDSKTGGILVYAEHVKSGDEPAYLRTNWLATALALMLSIEEQQYEKSNGTIHSYSYRLKGTDSRRFDKAWVNRIFLFLRRWAAVESGLNEERAFGAKPKGSILLTHDVDAISKTWAIRLKQGLFCGYNACKNASCGKMSKANKKAGQALKFFFSSCDYWNFARILELEEQSGVRSTFLFSGAGSKGKSLKSLLFDPNYSLDNPRLNEMFRHLSSNGWQIGLHPSYDTWTDWEGILREKGELEAKLERPVEVCRQHWLRFSLKDTWKAQEQAGLKTDLTLGFNDRTGFRNSAALAIRPLNQDSFVPVNITSIPMILMDSHVYDYQDLLPQQRQAIIKQIIDEVKFVGGTASIIWHQQVMNSDYGWTDGYEELLECYR